MFKKILLSPWIALLTLFLVVAVRVVDPSFVESVRLRYFDTLITNKSSTANNIFTVNIDEAALDRYGQWPLPRNVYADIIQDLYNRHAGLVILDVVMSEKDRMGGDTALADMMKQYPVILANIPAEKTKNEPRAPGSAVMGSDHLDRIVQYPGLIANVPALEENAIGIGSVNTMPEIDGVNRRVPLISAVNGKLYPSLAMEALRVAGNDTTFQVKLNENGVEKMRIPAFGPIATDSLGRIWVDWSQQNQQISVTNLPKDFNGAVVIVGPTAAGIANPVPTAKGAVFPQDMQAAVLGTMINGVTIQRPDYADGLEIVAILLAGVLLIIFAVVGSK
jgi:adenylate cyclase